MLKPRVGAPVLGKKKRKKKKVFEEKHFRERGQQVQRAGGGVGECPEHVRGTRGDSRPRGFLGAGPKFILITVGCPADDRLD